jgi:RNA polymerase sigma-70 factor, ECF subfamily
MAVSALLAALAPAEPDAHALAATIRYAEARRRARLDADGVMVPLSEQDPARWDATLIAEAGTYLDRGRALGQATPRLIQAALHGLWCRRTSRAEPPPWSEILRLYDELLALRDDPIVRLNRLVPLAETAGPEAGLAELETLSLTPALQAFLPYQALRADLLRRCGRRAEAAEAYRAALRLGPARAEARWLERRLAAAEEQRCGTGLV